jgi:hypothetical protein
MIVRVGLSLVAARSHRATLLELSGARCVCPGSRGAFEPSAFQMHRSGAELSRHQRVRCIGDPIGNPTIQTRTLRAKLRASSREESWNINSAHARVRVAH